MMKLFNKTSTWLSILVALWWCVDLTSAHDAVLYTEHPVDDDENYETYAVYEELTAIQCNVKCAMAHGKCDAVKRKQGRTDGRGTCLLMKKRSIGEGGASTSGNQLEDGEPGIIKQVVQAMRNIPPEIHWTDWSPWSACPLGCSDGNVFERNRACSSPAYSESQRICFGPDTETQPCTLAKTAVQGYQQVANNICFGAKDETPAVFTFSLQTGCYKIKLQHLSGGVKCNTGYSAYPFGCYITGEDVFVSVTGSEKSDLIIGSSDFTEQQGSGANVQHIATGECFVMTTNDSYKIWYDQDLHDQTEHNNGGQSCVSVHAVDDDC